MGSGLQSRQHVSMLVQPMFETRGVNHEEYSQALSRVFEDIAEFFFIPGVINLV